MQQDKDEIMQDIKNSIIHIEECFNLVKEKPRTRRPDPNFTYADGLCTGYAICLEEMYKILRKNYTPSVNICPVSGLVIKE